MISAELAEFMQSGISILIGTRNAGCRPEAVRGCGLRVEGADEVTVLVPEATSTRTVSYLQDSPRIAVCLSRPYDHRTLQLKGRVIELRPGAESERELADRYIRLWVDQLKIVAVPPRVSGRLNAWPCVALRVKVEQLFDQTPGPGAGRPLSPQGDITQRESPQGRPR